jgi:hypothetical protein
VLSAAGCVGGAKIQEEEVETEQQPTLSWPWSCRDLCGVSLREEFSAHLVPLHSVLCHVVCCLSSISPRVSRSVTQAVVVPCEGSAPFEESIKMTVCLLCSKSFNGKTTTAHARPGPTTGGRQGRSGTKERSEIRSPWSSPSSCCCSVCSCSLRANRWIHIW